MKQKNFYRYFITLISIFAFSNVLAQNNSTAVPFLNIVPDSRSAAMGDVGAATSANVDPNALFHNPAKLAFDTARAAVSLSYTPWLRNIGVKDANLGYLAGYNKIDERQTIGASLKYFSLGNIPFTNEQGELIQQFRASEFALDVSYIRSMGNRLALSLTARYIHSSLGDGNYNNISVKPGNALAVDVGIYSKILSQLFNKEGTLAIGANISNLGTKIQYGAQKSFLPANLRIGASAELNLDEKNRIGWSVDLNKSLIPSNDSLNLSLPSAIGKSFSPLDLSVGSGFEYWYDDLLAIRTGYYAAPSKYQTQYLTTGVGLRYKQLKFDMSYLFSTKSRSAIDNTLRLTITYQIQN